MRKASKIKATLLSFIAKHISYNDIVFLAAYKMMTDRVKSFNCDAKKDNIVVKGQFKIVN